MYISIQEYSLYPEGKCRRLHINPFTHLLSQVLVQSFIHLLSRSQLQATNCKIQKHQGLPALSASHLLISPLKWRLWTLSTHRLWNS